MTLYELKNTLREANAGLSYFMWKQAGLTIAMLGKERPKTPQEANPELYPPKKTYKMPEWVRKKYMKQKGVEYIER